MQTVNNANQLTLKPAYVDLSTTKTQMVILAVVCLIVCFGLYWKALFTGFLLDDFLHIDYIAKGFAGDWEPFLNNFTGNWAGSDLMKSYRPATSLSLLVDYFFFGTNAVGFHVTNVVLLYLCALLVGLITVELTGGAGARIKGAAAIWAALLFSVYPLHPEATVWIIGRVDLLCTFFYLLSLYCYFRFRLLKEKSYLTVALFSFALSFFSKEMAITLPAVIACAEVLVVANRNGALAQRFLYVGFFFAAFCLLASLRSLLLGTVIGGYGESLWQSAGNFFDKSTLVKLFLPMNEELTWSSWLSPASLAAYAGIALSFVARFLQRSCAYRPFLFLVLWMVIAVAPTFQIWHIYPNLVGSRLFFLSSAPFCMLLALAALPALDNITKKLALPYLIGPSLALALLYVCWSMMLFNNLLPWESAGRQMSALATAVQAFGKSGEKVVFVDLPTDFSGAPMLTRELYLDILAAPPFQADRLGRRFLTIEPPVGGSHEFMWPGQYKHTIGHQGARPLRFDKTGGSFVPLSTNRQGRPYAFVAQPARFESLVIDPPQAKLPDARSWKVLSQKDSYVSQFPDFVRIFPGRGNITVQFPEPAVQQDGLNPRYANVAFLRMKLTAKGAVVPAGKVRLVWEGLQKGPGNEDRSVKGSAPLADLQSGSFDKPIVLWLGRYRAWTLADRITKIGLLCDSGEYFADLKSIEINKDELAVPRSFLTVTGSRKPEAYFRLKTTVKQPLLLIYDVNRIPGAIKAKIICSRPGTTYDANNDFEIAQIMPVATQSSSQFEVETMYGAGAFELPKNMYSFPGLYQLRVLALDREDAMVGLPGEPVTVEILAADDKAALENKR